MVSTRQVFRLSGRGLQKRVGTLITKKRKASNPVVIITCKVDGKETSNPVATWNDSSDGDSSWKEIWKSDVRVGEDETFGFGQFPLFEVNGGDEGASIRIRVMNWSEKVRSLGGY